MLPDEEGRACGRENEGGVSQFGIFIVEKEEELQSGQESVMDPSDHITAQGW